MRKDSLDMTWTAKAPAPRPAKRGAALLVHMYPSGPGLGTCYSLGVVPVIIGRDTDCNIAVAHQSVSRRHARVEPGCDGYYVYDLQSTNGTYINDAPVAEGKLRDGDYLRVGGCIYRFLAGSNIEVEYHEEIYRLTINDGLVGIPNKRYLTEFLERELSRSLRYSRPLSLVLFDLDHFKRVNDRLGHLGGDYTLREVTAQVKEHIRRDELFARYGGEEFALVLPETTLQGAIAISERVRQCVESHRFVYEDESFRVTISLGAATTAGGEVLTPQDLIAQADAKLYQAKREGRNRVVA